MLELEYRSNSSKTRRGGRMKNRSLVAGVLMVCMTASGVGAETLTLREALSREAERAAAQAAPSSGAGNGLKWTGVSLLGVGGAFLVGAALTDTEGSTCALGTCVDNESIRTGRFIIGGALAGVGGFLLAKGVSKGRQTSPSVTFTRNGVALGQRIAF
jgi:hypothetical protein